MLRSLLSVSSFFFCVCVCVCVCVLTESTSYKQLYDNTLWCLCCFHMFRRGVCVGFFFFPLTSESSQTSNTQKKACKPSAPYLDVYVPSFGSKQVLSGGLTQITYLKTKHFKNIMMLMMVRS
ncbi:hypothetical protein QBC46DRAFT_139792 [Diplogelasinospora grovesii]|uniref:Secreted protein n=1 Tax=Diplogelasinospora grovesii TaxID=303347 RepID=A0AAN6N806_9PEZI|nr:hypothetical protein QBC46DRAFT_139792 [Diplogelasinospora grovesii]